MFTVTESNNCTYLGGLRRTQLVNSVNPQGLIDRASIGTSTQVVEEIHMARAFVGQSLRVGRRSWKNFSESMQPPSHC